MRVLEPKLPVRESHVSWEWTGLLSLLQSLPGWEQPMGSLASVQTHERISEFSSVWCWEIHSHDHHKWSFSDFSEHTNHRFLLKCRLWFSKSSEGPESLQLWPDPRGCLRHWSEDHTLGCSGRECSVIDGSTLGTHYSSFHLQSGKFISIKLSYQTNLQAVVQSEQGCCVSHDHPGTNNMWTAFWDKIWNTRYGNLA